MEVECILSAEYIGVFVIITRLRFVLKLRLLNVSILSIICHRLLKIEFFTIGTPQQTIKGVDQKPQIKRLKKQRTFEGIV